MPSKQNRLAFLLGSGISIPAEMPSTRDITEQVLSNGGILRSIVGVYYFDASHMGIDLPPFSRTHQLS